LLHRVGFLERIAEDDEDAPSPGLSPSGLDGPSRTLAGGASDDRHSDESANRDADARPAEVEGKSNRDGDRRN
jgi:hypothetical protein